MKQTITYKGSAICYAEYGKENGYPVFVQHGLISSIDDHYLFDRLIRLNVRLICVSRPGYGESAPVVMASFGEWADIISLILKCLNIITFDILGISSGAPYSYSIASRFPDKVRNVFIYSGIPALYDEVVLSY